MSALYVHGKVTNVFGATLDYATVMGIVAMVMDVEISDIPLDRKAVVMDWNGIRAQRDGKVLPENSAAEADALRLKTWRDAHPVEAAAADAKRAGARAAWKPRS